MMNCVLKKGVYTVLMGKEHRNYSEDDLRQAEECMSVTQEALSEKREKGFDTHQEGRFLSIDPKTIADDESLRKFLISARISQSKRGDGVFISGSRSVNVDTVKLGAYGIPVPGGLIIPVRGNKEEISREIERIGSVVSLLDDEKVADRLSSERRKAEAEKAEKETYLTPFRELCEKYPELGLCFESSEYWTGINNNENNRVYDIIASSVSRPTAEEFRQALDAEVAIREFRNKNFEHIIELQKKLTDAHAGSIIAYDWRGKEIGTAFQSPDYWLPLSHKLYFDGDIEWSEEGLRILDERAGEKIAKIATLEDGAMNELRKLPVSGASVKVEWNTLEVDGARITFPTSENAREAEVWALERGAYLSYHHNLGEFRDRAKEEGWSQKESRVALAVLQGDLPYITVEKSTGHSPDGMRETTSYHDEISIGGDRLGIRDGRNFDRQVDFDGETRMMLKFFVETHPLEAPDQPINFDTADKEELVAYVRAIHEKKKLQKEQEIAKANEAVIERAKEAGNKYSFEFLGTSKSASGVKTFGFQINKGTAGWRVSQRLKDPKMLSGKLSTGWSIWVKEEDLDDLGKFFVPREEHLPETTPISSHGSSVPPDRLNRNPEPTTSSIAETSKRPESSGHNPFADALKNWGKK